MSSAEPGPLATAEFAYELPEAAIAREPADPRDSARLLVDGGPGAEPTHSHVRDLPGLLREGDVVVVNDTRVLPARLRLHRASGGAAEILLLEQTGEAGQWRALARPSRKLREGECLTAGPELTVQIGEDHGDGHRTVVLHTSGDWLAALERYGEVPLPPYLAGVDVEAERYQTVYARRPASAAAPTAGLHLTPEVLEGIAARGVEVHHLELVVGLDTFRPISTDLVSEHRMHTEAYRIPTETLAACEAAQRVVAVGTTTLRALESAARSGRLEGRTDLFLSRGSEFLVVDALLTNFHLPRSSLLVLIDAFVGPRWRELYDLALADGYRFLSFGDAMLLERDR